MKKINKHKVEILRIIKTTPVGLHSWVEAKIGDKIEIIKKENKNIPKNLTLNRDY